MTTLKRTAMAAAAALLALASTSIAQVTDYRDIKTPRLRQFQVQQPKRIQLGNGMVIFLQEDHELPLIRGTAKIRGGERDTPAAKAGFAQIYGGAWRTGGTQSRTGDQLDELLESRAARIETNAGEDASSVTLDVLKGDFDTVFPIFVELLRKPAFREDKIDLARTQANTAISRRNDNPQSILMREATKLAHGADSPYARVPEYATVASITRDDLLAFHDRFVVPNNIVLGVVGDFDSAKMEKKLRDTFGSWKRGADAPAAVTGGTPAKPGVYYAAKDDVTQANIAAVHPGGPLRSSPDYPAIAVMNEILSGGFSGRLANHIRSQMGLAYAVGGGLDVPWDRPGAFDVFMSTKSQSTLQSIDAVKAEVRDLQAKPFTAEELSLAKDTILNRFIFTMDSPVKILNQQMMLEFYHYPADFWQKYPAAIQKVTAADVERVAKKYVRPDQLAILVVGKESDFEKPLKTAGEVTPIDITIPEPGTAKKPAAGAAAAPAAPAATTAEAAALARKVRDFVGGKAAVDAVQTTHSVVSASMNTPQGAMELEIDQILRYPDAQRQVMKTPMGEIVMVITPAASFMTGPMGTQDLPASQRDNMRTEHKFELLSVLKNIESPAYAFGIAGTEKAGDLSAQVLTITTDGTTVKWFVDPGSGKLLRVVRSGRMGEQSTDYTSWKKAGDLNVPAAFTITTNGQKSGSGELKTIEVNPPLDAKLFEKPAAK